MSRFIVFEGMDGVGKSTQAKILADHLGALYTKQPGGEPSAEVFRQMLLDPKSQISDYVESLIFTIDRALHVEKILKPALEAGQDVVCDRYVGSFLAYQGYGRGGDMAFLRELSENATGGLKPDLVIFLWRDKARRKEYSSDRIESENGLFHKRVQEGYRELAKNENWAVVSAEGSPEIVHERILKIL